MNTSAVFQTQRIQIEFAVVAGMGGGEGTPGGEAGFHLQHPDLNAVVKAVTEAGHPPASDIDEGHDGCRGVTLRDPDGNTFKVLQNV